ncbi:uncharacterized protein EDB93DRAFT_1339313 [Suillus bovinus]|uniref:uncharacterized protein n=1 Tax=Suillus bovinus TaxID=48563 RepID=UPI001B86CBCC|nr:uncharacterized protein EDB93DRAFT_1339313 [Suillus bovinus]KAG2137164.1 hypothetical protein EDB93DRAFT_1339313 [Suillus bovinus]
MFRNSKTTVMSMHIFGNEATEEKAEKARLSSFVGVLALGDLVKSTLGPKGMNKILKSASSGDINVTNDDATILKSIQLDNAAAKILVNISKVQDDEVGDGTTSVSDAAKFRQDLFNIAGTTLSSKVLSQDKDYFANLAVDAVLRLKGSTDLEHIQIIKKVGGKLTDSYLDEGFILDKSIAVNSLKRMENAKILITNTCIQHIPEMGPLHGSDFLNPEHHSHILDSDHPRIALEDLSDDSLTFVNKTYNFKITSVGASVREGDFWNCPRDVGHAPHLLDHPFFIRALAVTVSISVILPSTPMRSLLLFGAHKYSLESSKESEDNTENQASSILPEFIEDGVTSQSGAVLVKSVPDYPRLEPSAVVHSYGKHRRARAASCQIISGTLTGRKDYIDIQSFCRSPKESRWAPENGMMVIKVYTPSTNDLWAAYFSTCVTLSMFTCIWSSKLSLRLRFSGSAMDTPEYYFERDEDVSVFPIGAVAEFLAKLVAPSSTADLTQRDGNVNRVYAGKVERTFSDLGRTQSARRYNLSAFAIIGEEVKRAPPLATEFRDADDPLAGPEALSPDHIAVENVLTNIDAVKATGTARNVKCILCALTLYYHFFLHSDELLPQLSRQHSALDSVR